MVNTNSGYTNLEDLNKKLIDSILSGNIYSIKEVIKEGGNINYKGKGGITPLMHFLKDYRGENSLEVFKELLREGASINPKNDEKSTPLMFLCDSDIPHKFSIACILIEKDRCINHKNKQGMSPLMLFSKYSNLPYNLEIMEFLLLNGADPNLVGRGYTAIAHSAMCNDSPDAIRLLLDYGADINVTQKDGYSPLMAVCQFTENRRTPDIIKTLIELGADINQVTTKGSPLSLAVVSGSLDKVTILLDYGADVNLLNSFGYTSLMEGVLPSKGISPDILRVLLESGADPTKRAYGGRSPLGYIIRNSKNDSNYEVVKILLRWAQLNGTKYEDEDEFIFDAIVQKWVSEDPKNNHKIILELIRSGIKTDSLEQNYRTPLMEVTLKILESREKIVLEDSTLDLLLKSPVPLNTYNRRKKNIIDLILMNFNGSYSDKISLRQKIKLLKILIFFIRRRTFWDNKEVYLKAFIKESFGRRRYHKIVTFIIVIINLLGYLSYWTSLKTLFVLYILINIMENIILKNNNTHFIKRSLSTSMKLFLFNLSIDLFAGGRFAIPFFIIISLNLLDIKADE